MRQKWIKILQIKYDTSKSKICSRHFEEDCFHWGKLKSEAKPSLFLGHEKSEAHIKQEVIDIDIPIGVPIKEEMVEVNDQEKVESDFPKRFSLDSMAKHENPTKTKHDCEICGKTYSSKYTLINHQNLYHSDTVSFCKCDFENCGKQFRSRQIMKQHQRDVHAEYNLPCEICHVKFKSKLGLDRHLRRVHNEVYKCEHCWRSFSSAGRWQFHMEQTHPTKIQKSPKKEEDLNLENKLEVIVKEEDIELPKDFPVNFPASDSIDLVPQTQSIDLQLDFDQDDQDTQKRLMKAQEQHTPFLQDYLGDRKVHTKLFHCQKCKKSFVSHGELRAHISTHYRGVPEPKKFKCQHCVKSFDNQHNLKQHEKNEHGLGFEAMIFEEKLEAKKKCPFCPTWFEHQSEFEKHSNSCSKSKGKKKCDYCPTFFSFEGARVDHMNSVHLGKKYDCDICGKTYTNKYTLTSHKKTEHSDTVSFWKCDFDNCGKQFKSRQIMKQHQRDVHVDFKIPCEICGVKFKSKLGLDRHLRKIHNEVYKCDHCFRAFSSKEKWQLHMEQRHSPKKSPQKKKVSKRKSKDDLESEEEKEFEIEVKSHIDIVENEVIKTEPVNDVMNTPPKPKIDYNYDARVPLKKAKKSSTKINLDLEISNGPSIDFQIGSQSQNDINIRYDFDHDTTTDIDFDQGIEGSNETNMNIKAEPAFILPD